MLGKRKWLPIVLLASLATVTLGLSAVADSASEAGFLAKINASRAANGLAALSVHGGLRSHARNHTQDMIDADELHDMVEMVKYVRKCCVRERSMLLCIKRMNLIGDFLIRQPRVLCLE